MADYYNPDWITDLHVKDIAERETITVQLSKLDSEIESVCIAKGVLADQIPVDGEDGYITSSTLKTYATFWIYTQLLAEFWGGASGDLVDIYRSKLDYYNMQMQEAYNKLTYENIMGVNLSQSSYIQSVPMY